MAQQRIPSRGHPCWMALVTGQIGGQFELLATRILATRLNRKYRRDPSSKNVELLAAEAREFFATNGSIAHNDLRLMVEECHD